MLVEVCVSSMSSIKNAATAGADRIELCSALELGGLTPSAGFIRQALDLNILPIHCLIRPRQGHFFYSSEEITLIEQNIKNANLLGCQGVVVGMHNNKFKLDIPLLKKWKSLAGSMFITFHRAFDVLINPEESLEQLIELGFDCVLTSGQNENAIDGINNLKSWNEKFGLQINIMPGGGIGIDNCKIFK
jgi:copper homeostasis protein